MGIQIMQYYIKSLSGVLLDCALAVSENIPFVIQYGDVFQEQKGQYTHRNGNIILSLMDKYIIELNKSNTTSGYTAKCTKDCDVILASGCTQHEAVARCSIRVNQNKEHIEIPCLFIKELENYKNRMHNFLIDIQSNKHIALKLNGLM